MRIQELLLRLDKVKKTSNGWIARCPAHNDKRPSLSIARKDGRILLKCFAGCSIESILDALGLEKKDLVDSFSSPGYALHTCTHNRQHTKNTKDSGVHTKNGDPHTCTLKDYAEAKRLPVEFLTELGLSDCKYRGKPAVRIPYHDSGGAEQAVRFRIALNGKDKFRWRTGSKPFLYGLQRLNQQADWVVLVEGESDCHTLWHHGFNALGVPGANNWREDRDAEHLESFERIYVIQEPDQGGEAVLKWLGQSKIKGRTFVVRPNGYKDPSDLHIKNPEKFKQSFEDALDQAIPFATIETQIRNEKAKIAWEVCKELAVKNDILKEFCEVLPRCGLAGEEKNAQILFLALVSRLLDRPVNVVVSGPSSSGKSFLVETVLRFFPRTAYHDLSAMSERNLAYTKEPLQHRFLVLYEAAGLSGDFATYLIRSLLSEGCIRYEFVEKTKDGLRSRLVEKEGPTGLIMTTTRVWLHPENETRLLTITIRDDKEQTQNVLLAIAQEHEEPEFEAWHAFQTWLECQGVKVKIPYATTIAELTKPVAIRLRRDFPAFLSLIKAHALLHMSNRPRDRNGNVIATLSDYTAVLGLVGDIIADGVEATVPDSVKETVAVVRELIEESDEDPPCATVNKVKDKLNLDRSAALRRLKTCIRRGFVCEVDSSRGREKKYALGETLPTEVGGIFPTLEKLEKCMCANHQKTAAHVNSKEYRRDSDEVCRCAGGVGGIKNKHTSDFDEAFKRYIPPSQNVTTSQPNNHAGSEENQNVTRDNDVTFQGRCKSASDNDCDGVTVENTPSQGRGKDGVVEDYSKPKLKEPNEAFVNFFSARAKPEIPPEPDLKEPNWITASREGLKGKEGDRIPVLEPSDEVFDDEGIQEGIACIFLDA